MQEFHDVNGVTFCKGCGGRPRNIGIGHRPLWHCDACEGKKAEPEGPTYCPVTVTQETLDACRSAPNAYVSLPSYADKIAALCDPSVRHEVFVGAGGVRVSAGHMELRFSSPRHAYYFIGADADAGDAIEGCAKYLGVPEGVIEDLIDRAYNDLCASQSPFRPQPPAQKPPQSTGSP